MAEQNNMPTRKMGAVGIAGALTTIIITISRDAFAYEMTADLAAAVTALITFAAGYFTPNVSPQDRPMHKLKVPFAFVLLVLLSACQTLGVPEADTFNKRVIVANGIVEQSVTTVSTLVTAGKLSREDGRRTLDRIKEAAVGIDVARQILPDDPQCRGRQAICRHRHTERHQRLPGSAAMSNALILTELLLNYAVKMQEIGVLFRNAQGGDVSDEQVNASSLSRDVAIAKAESVVGGTAQQPSALR